jgi:hypothetical protein
VSGDHVFGLASCLLIGHGNASATDVGFSVHLRDETRVLVTFLEHQAIDLRARGIDEAHAAELRSRLATFAED